jgi:hypothetical protein
MTTEKPRMLPRIMTFAVASFALWAIAVGWAAWYLPRMVAEEYRTGLRTNTNGDSIGLPLFSFAILLAAVLIMLDLAFVGFLIWRAHVGTSSPARPAV